MHACSQWQWSLAVTARWEDGFYIEMLEHRKAIAHLGASGWAVPPCSGNTDDIFVISENISAWERAMSFRLSLVPWLISWYDYWVVWLSVYLVYGDHHPQIIINQGGKTKTRPQAALSGAKLEIFCQCWQIHSDWTILDIGRFLYCSMLVPKECKKKTIQWFFVSAKSHFRTCRL